VACRRRCHDRVVILGNLVLRLMLLVALLSSADRVSGIFEAVGAGAVSGLFMYLGIRLASATQRDLHDV